MIIQEPRFSQHKLYHKDSRKIRRKTHLSEKRKP